MMRYFERRKAAYQAFVEKLRAIWETTGQMMRFFERRKSAYQAFVEKQAERHNGPHLGKAKDPSKLIPSYSPGMKARRESQEAALPLSRVGSIDRHETAMVEPKIT
jgi:hypothetical protein